MTDTCASPLVLEFLMWHPTRLKDNIDILIQIPASKYFYLFFYHIKRFHIFFTVLKEFIYAKIILNKNPVQIKGVV